MTDGARSRARSAFTLIELLVVVSVIALLIAILLPSLKRSREVTRSAVCLSNLRQFAIASHAYAHTFKDRYPIAQYSETGGTMTVSRAWDVTTESGWQLGPSGWVNATKYRPGVLWTGAETIEEVHQCPSLRPDGDSWTGYEFTGYNYNTSYIGKGENEQPTDTPARIGDVKHPSETALFGDGEYYGGMNKFMRAPFADLTNGGDTGEQASAGTQAYRHLERTNVVFSDGHAAGWQELYAETAANQKQNVLDAPQVGFLSEDNSLYDLR
jgi:prepilin-type N-terminal cleavage/methylation domain-containing protein/prepilin-type processing-associated H-X9-DG protein